MQQMTTTATTTKNATMNNFKRSSSMFDGLITQSLGGISYSLNPSKLKQETPIWKRILKIGGMIVISPILIPTTILYTISMYFGPQWYHDTIVSKFIPFGMSFLAKSMDWHRKVLLKNLSEGHIVLDVGSGGGHYIKYFSKASYIVALEPVEKMHPIIMKRAIEEVKIDPNRLELVSDTLEVFLKNNPHRIETFDWIILGNVLCEVDHQQSTLNTIHQLLKPGGHVYFSEHIASPKGSWNRLFQNCINPIWSTVSGGCNCNRDSLEMLQNMKEWEVIYWNYYPFIKVGGGPFITGLARKKE